MMTMMIERCEGKKLKEKPGTKRQREHKKKTQMPNSTVQHQAHMIVALHQVVTVTNSCYAPMVEEGHDRGPMTMSPSAVGGR